MRELKQKVMNELKKTFRPEFLNRLDEIIIFNKLGKEAIEKIASIMLNEFADKLKQREITVKIDKSIIEYIVKVRF